MRARRHPLAVTRQRRVPWRGGEQPRRPRLPFGRVLCITGMQFIAAAARMRVDEQQALVLAGERVQDFEHQYVFVDVGEVAGVVLVAVFHETFFTSRAVYTLSDGGTRSCRDCRRCWSSVFSPQQRLVPPMAMTPGNAPWLL